jgi:hypothetical protein
MQELCVILPKRKHFNLSLNQISVFRDINLINKLSDRYVEGADFSIGNSIWLNTLLYVLVN